MLQHLGPGNITVFVDVSNHKYRNSLGLAQLHHGHGAVLHLGNTARRGLVFLPIEGLDGINHQNIRLQLLHRFQNVRQPGFGENIQAFRRDAQPLGPQLQLTLAFLAGYIQYASSCTQTAAYLKQQGRFSDTGCAAHQHQ